MEGITLILHAPGAPGLRWLGLGPGWKPSRGILKLQRLFNQHAFWAQGRSIAELKRMLQRSSAVVSLWQGKRLVGFGRASCDGIYRAVLWDVVVPKDLQGKGLGRLLIEGLIKSPQLRNVERIYLMTTNSSGFYSQVGFKEVPDQVLMRRDAP
ncbi:MAG: N-acetyltransferase [Synechococcus sp. XM-24]|nr:MAG: N-acetyltransferase [Synechococcus sp. XM-24]